MLSTKCINAGLEPYVPSAEKPWNDRRIRHLFNRMASGASLSQVKLGRANGPGVLVDYMINRSKRTDYHIDLLKYPYGEQNSFKTADNFSEKYNKYLQLDSLWLDLMIKEGFRAKMALFWSNHFVTEVDAYGYQPCWMYMYMKIIFDNALGDFKQLVKDMGLTPAMLLYLNGNQNVKGRPNENYARELLELFTMGEGHYTQQDIVEVARALTGWNITYTYNATTGETIGPNKIGEYVFYKSNHDILPKRIFGQTITYDSRGTTQAQDTANAVREYGLIIDAIFNNRKTEIAKFICSKLYRFFVYQYPPDEIIDGLAQVFIDNNFKIEPVIKVLLSSEHFFEEEIMGTMIKSHTESLISYYKNLDLVKGDYDDEGDYYLYTWDNKTSPLNTLNRNPIYYLWAYPDNLGQRLMSPVNVAGWPGYRSWLNEFVMVNRWNYSKIHINSFLPYPFTKDKYRNFLKQLTNNSKDPKYITEQALLHFISTPLGEDILESCVAAFKGSVPENYYNDGSWDLDYPIVPEQFMTLMNYIVTLPEFQLM